MANPVIVPCTKDAWTKVATNITTATIYAKKQTATYWQTYRLTGVAAPTNLTDAIRCFDDGRQLTVSHSAPVDVYIYAAGKAGSVRVDA